MSLRDAQTIIHVSDMIAVFARDSVILLVSATKMVRIYLFTSSLLGNRGKEVKKCLRLSRILRCLYRSVIRSVNTVERKI